MTSQEKSTSSEEVRTAVEPLDIHLRAYAQPLSQKQSTVTNARSRTLEPSQWTLVFDTETTTDPSQRLRIGSYCLCKGPEVAERGLFHEAGVLSGEELELLRRYAKKRDLKLLTRAEFVDQVFLKIGYNCKATIVGFNLPFDISRIAIGHHSARGSMRGGFSFKLTELPYHPRVQVKHLSSRQALIQFTVPATQPRSRGVRNRELMQRKRRGFFVDVRTLGAALLGKTDSLETLSATLEVDTPKSRSDGHGKALTEDYLDYAVGDVETTWQCYCKLVDRYTQLGLKGTPPQKIFSEASVGKAYLREMGIKPWQKVQPDFPPELIGTIMSTYFGGRAEVRIRREIRQVIYCDFLSMYPTVCALMNLWRFVTANGVDWRDSTAETRDLLRTISLEELYDKDTWQRLPVLVQVSPDADMFPIRAKYGYDNQTTIGLNFLTSDQPLWFTLADCIASKLLTGKSPKVIRAITFDPTEIQGDLKLVQIMGNSDFTIDPAKSDFYLRTIDLRTSIKSQIPSARGSNREKLDRTQQFLKLLANSTSYGVFVEINVDKQDQLADVRIQGGTSSYVTKSRNIEKPGPFFHPLLATLITGAARLMLALCQRRVVDQGLDWAFCDTDSMAIAKSDAMRSEEFADRVTQITQTFGSLNPYWKQQTVLQIEDVNYSGNSKTLRKLFCFAVSAKRYALFNNDVKGSIEIRKVSGHGLGHMRPPYLDSVATNVPSAKRPLAEIGVPKWQHDVWHCVIDAAIKGRPDQVDLEGLPGMNAAAFSRYAATTPKLLRWFATHNASAEENEQVRPFNFLLAASVRNSLTMNCDPSALPTVGDCEVHRSDRIRPVAPFEVDPEVAAAKCFDRETGHSVPARLLKTYADALSHFHIHPETKFLNAEAYDRGPTKPRHIEVRGVCNIGKEANNLDARVVLGDIGHDDVEYGNSPQDQELKLAEIKQAASRHGMAKLARIAGVSSRHVASIVHGASDPRMLLQQKLLDAASQLDETRSSAEVENTRLVIQLQLLCEELAVGEIAYRSGVDRSNLAKMLKQQRSLSKSLRSWLNQMRRQ
jgi:AraC-like DNA-binding protein